MREATTGELILVRFSPMNTGKFLEQAKDHADECDALGEERVYAVSTFGDIKTADETVAELVTRICQEAQCGGERIWLVTGSILRENGYDPVLSEPPPHHYNVILGNELRTPDTEKLVELFRPGREKNPAWKRS